MYAKDPDAKGKCQVEKAKGADEKAPPNLVKLQLNFEKGREEKLQGGDNARPDFLPDEVKAVISKTGSPEGMVGNSDAAGVTMFVWRLNENAMKERWGSGNGDRRGGGGVKTAFAVGRKWIKENRMKQAQEPVKWMELDGLFEVMMKD